MALISPECHRLTHEFSAIGQVEYHSPAAAWSTRQASVPLTALGVVLGVQRLLELPGALVPPGLHAPEALVDPAYVVERMVETGAAFTGAPVGS